MVKHGRQQRFQRSESGSYAAMPFHQLLLLRWRRRNILFTFLVLCLFVVLKNASRDSLVDKFFTDDSGKRWMTENDSEETFLPTKSNDLLKSDKNSRSFKLRSDSEISAPFVPDQPKFLIIFAYQRTGSTFLGRLFSRNPEVFYMFEPLDSLYSSLYGTLMGWNVPSDITNDIHGMPRSLPEEEIDHVSTFLRSLLTCNTTSLPTETLFHPYMIDIFPAEFSTGTDYVPCVRKHRKLLRFCRSLTPVRYCSKRFCQKPERLRDCYYLMTNRTYLSTHQDRAPFDRYFNCTRTLRRVLDSQCTPYLRTACDRRPVRAVKLVRATMTSIVPLLEELPNLRVLHLVRDPRGVALSRKNFHSSGRGLYSEANKNQTTYREAVLFCQTAVRDLRIGAGLRGRFPGRILTLVYDEIVANLAEYANVVYRFLDLGIPPVVSEMISTATVNHTSSADQWQSVLTYKTSKDIKTACREFFQAVHYSWND